MSTQNRIADLNNHLFAQLERLGDESTKGEELREEIERAKAVTDIASQIIATGALALKARIAASDSLNQDIRLPAMLTD